MSLNYSAVSVKMWPKCEQIQIKFQKKFKKHFSARESTLILRYWMPIFFARVFWHCEDLEGDWSLLTNTFPCIPKLFGFFVNMRFHGRGKGERGISIVTRSISKLNIEVDIGRSILWLSIRGCITRRVRMKKQNTIISKEKSDNKKDWIP